jgi:hypothetical protein
MEVVGVELQSCARERRYPNRSGVLTYLKCHKVVVLIVQNCIFCVALCWPAGRVTSKGYAVGGEFHFELGKN